MLAGFLRVWKLQKVQGWLKRVNGSKINPYFKGWWTRCTLWYVRLVSSPRGQRRSRRGITQPKVRLHDHPFISTSSSHYLTVPQYLHEIWMWILRSTHTAPRRNGWLNAEFPSTLSPSARSVGIETAPESISDAEEYWFDRECLI